MVVQLCEHTKCWYIVHCEMVNFMWILPSWKNISSYCITSYPKHKENKYLLLYIAFEGQNLGGFSCIVPAQGLSWGIHQDVGSGHSHLKAWLGKGILPRFLRLLVKPIFLQLNGSLFLQNQQWRQKVSDASSTSSEKVEPSSKGLMWLG